MKIFYLYDSIALIGGLERVFVNKMNYLANQTDNEVYLVTSSQGQHPFSYPLSHKVNHIDLNINLHLQYRTHYPMRLWIKYKLSKLYKKRLQIIVNQILPDIIITPVLWKSNTLCTLKCQSKRIIESHTAKAYTLISENPLHHPFKELISRYIIKWKYNFAEKTSDAIVTLTQEDAKAWKYKSKIYIIPNIIETIPIESSSCEIHRVIAAGRLTYQKGFDRLIKAWEIVHQKHPNWELAIYGEGIYKKQLDLQITEANLEKVVHIYPFISNIFKEYLNSSIYVLSSNYEGFGMVLIEAMACGLPCISFNCPCGPSEIIKDQEDGLLIKNGDINGMSNAICQLIENETKRKEYGRNAKLNAERFLPKNIMPHWEKLFKELVKR